VWRHIADELGERRPLVVASVVRDSGSVPRRTGAKMVVAADGRTTGSVGGGIFETLVVRDALAALRGGVSGTHSYSFNPKGTCDDAFGAVCGGRADVFLEVVMPTDRLLIVGGGHCGRALARAASLLDFSITVADDREEFSRPQDFALPGVEQVLHLPPDYRGLPEPDPQTYVALVSKGFLTDEAALRAESATREFNAITSDLPSFIPPPDGTQRIRNASHVLKAARDEMMMAHKRLDDFVKHGVVPDDLKPRNSD